MKYFAAIPLAASLAAAQMSAMSLAPAPSTGPVTHTVIVGGMKPVATGMAPVLGYSPESITAAQGDKVKFVFMQKNHTATQSTFADPCKKMEGGLDSGFMPNPEGKAGVEWEMDVTTTEPLWFYCKQQNGIHCGKGMVFAINAKSTGDKTFSAWKQLAVNKNGTALSSAAIASVGAGAAAAAPTPVTVVAGDSAATATGTAAGAVATVAQGQGTTGDGQACSCQCLCGTNSFPAAAAQNNFGGFAGMIQ
ncbi:hypothetical protein GQ43DRAFT_363913 [Delitschia confertaspora ATCC 74209]|uniref:Uncharacterized protein n=1 Tax=Delitschia confertaspora ATCC 74209 TaxID=1513339 RepID=A0A9P4JX23_9PLEO|nr:hypothetical protein GQ43DRAFT_363913 [Delitschia confertaspora ATCC 74209]